MKKYIYSIILFFSVSAIFAQGTIFGLADGNLGIIRPNYSAAGLARSYEVADDDSLHLNYQNFSTWSNITYTTYEVDLAFTMAESEDALGKNYYRDGGGFLGGFLAMPIIQKKLAFGVGIQPVISIEHSVRDTSNEYGDQYVILRGGLSRITANISYRPLKILGFGFGFEYNFGTIEDFYRLKMADNGSTLDFKYEYRFNGSGAVISAFFAPFDFITFGGLYRTPVNLTNEIYATTNVSEVDAKITKKMTLPSQYNLGVMIGLSNRIKLGGDIIYQDWVKEYKIEGRNFLPHQHEYFRIGIGLEIKESEKRFTNFFNTLNYRAGVFYGTQKQTSNRNPVLEYGVSMGLSFPLQRFVSRVDLTGLVGRRGDLNDNYYEENYVQFGISISTNERWFRNTDD